MAGPAADEDRLDYVDYAVVFASMALALGIGAYHAYAARHTNTVLRYLLADRKVKSVAIAMSAFSTLVSPLSMVGVPAEAYAYGTQMAIHVAAHLVAFPLYTHVLVPVYVGLNSSSIYTFFQFRYNKFLWKFCAVSGLVDMVLNISITVFAASNVLYRATGLGVWPSAIIIVVICVIYTAIGGMKAVIWTDFLQGIIILITIAFIVTLGMIRAGGIANVVQKSAAGGRLELFNFSLDLTTRHTFWSGVFGNFVLILVHRIGNQAAVQRFLTAENLATARRATILGMSLFSGLFLLLMFVGLMIYATYSGCDPVTNKGMSQNQLVPMFIMSLFRPYSGLQGLFLASMVAALLSTVSSMLNALSTVSLQDFSPTSADRWSDKKKIVFCQILIIVYGTLSLLGINVLQLFDNVLQAGMILNSTVAASILTLILFGTLLPQVNITAAAIAEVLGVFLCLWIAIGNMLYGRRHPMMPMSSKECDVIDTWINGTDHTTTDMWNVTTDSPSMTPQHSETFPLYNISFSWFSCITFLSITSMTYVLTMILGPNKCVRHKEIIPDAVQGIHRSLSRKVRRLLLCDIYQEEDNEVPQRVYQLKALLADQHGAIHKENGTMSA